MALFVQQIGGILAQTAQQRVDEGHQGHVVEVQDLEVVEEFGQQVVAYVYCDLDGVPTGWVVG